MLLNQIKRQARHVLQHTNSGYRYLLKRDLQADGPHGLPDAPWHNAVLQSAAEVEQSLQQVRRLGLPRHNVPAKNWDSLAALDLLLGATDRRARIFDAGGELYSQILPWLFLYGYRNLTAGNLAFTQPVRKGPIKYEYADITRTRFADAHFDAVICQSVIEHGVDIETYFKEMARIIKTDGLLIVSTDYFETSIDTRGQQAYGVPIHVFNKQEILDVLQVAKRCGFEITSPLRFECTEKAVHWPDYDLRYTFVIFSMRKVR